ncbi:MAG: hypothetical protein SFY92_10740 [Verrucomicrobiae bacterium]|nr:hypothetical protein [Verrucomicrobiae bacterium]
MKHIALYTCLAALSLALTHSASGADDKKGAADKNPNKIMLVDMDPAEAEFGTYEYPDEKLRESIQKQHGPGVFDTGAYISGNKHWPLAQKIVKDSAKAPKINAEDYRSNMLDRFQIQGQPLDGVGFWVQVFSMYHLYEYNIPPGAKKFEADLGVTDDSKGYMIGMPGGPDAYIGWQEATFRIFIDGKQVYEFKRHKVSVPMGSGEMLDEISVNIPAGAKKIKFILESSDALDWNKNVELVLGRAAFVK